MKSKLLFLSLVTFMHVAEGKEMFDRLIPPTERKEFMNSVGIGSSTTVWEEIGSTYSRATKYGVDSINPNEGYLLAKHAGESPFAPLVVFGGGALSLLLGVNTLRHGMCTVADILFLKSSFAKEFGKTLLWGTGTGIVLIPTVIAGYSMYIALNGSKKN